MASNEDLSFEQILETISDEEMMRPYKGLTLGDNEAHPDLDNKDLSVREQKLNLAFWAKAVRAHVGWDSFGEANQNGFKKEVEKIYKEINENNAPRNQKEFMMSLAEATCPFVQDRHFQLSTGGSEMRGGGNKEVPNVGENIAYRPNKPEGFVLKGEGREKPKNDEQDQGKEPKTPEAGEKIYWQIGTMKGKDGEDILIVSIPNMGNKVSYEDWKDFIETFDKIYQDDKEKWDKGRIILDVRGNKGGEDKPIDHVAKRLYGNLVNTYKRCEINDTPLGNFFLHKHGAFKPKNLKRDKINPKRLLKRHCFSKQKQTLFDETKRYYPFNKTKGYNGRIDILIDRAVASAAESAYTSFYHHPNVRYIGENTAGMQQYTQGNITLPCGYAMRVACSKLTYWDKEGENIECVGHEPDFPCRGHDALEIALSVPKDEDRVMGLRDLNEPRSKKEVYADYNPEDPTDQRKPYFAKFIEPALWGLERCALALSSARARLQKKQSKPENAAPTNSSNKNADSSQMRRPPTGSNGL